MSCVEPTSAVLLPWADLVASGRGVLLLLLSTWWGPTARVMPQCYCITELNSLRETSTSLQVLARKEAMECPVQHLHRAQFSSPHLPPITSAVRTVALPASARAQHHVGTPGYRGSIRGQPVLTAVPRLHGLVLDTQVGWTASAVLECPRLVPAGKPF